MIVPGFHDRKTIPKLLREKAICVEIGTHQGQFAAQLLQHENIKLLHCVDPWKSLPEYKTQEQFLEFSDGDRREDYRIACAVLDQYGDRAKLRCLKSEEAVHLFADNFLDLVYIDGNHLYKYVKWDLKHWWQKLRSGGILAGHDILMYGDPVEDNWPAEIQPAVFEFCEKNNVDCHLITEDGLPWSYYIVKP